MVEMVQKMSKCKNNKLGHVWSRNDLGGLVQDICIYCGAVNYPVMYRTKTHSSNYTSIKYFEEVPPKP